MQFYAPPIFASVRVAMQNILQELYDKMRASYQAWSEKPSPHHNYSPSSLIGTPNAFERMANFRREEWDRYVSDRDTYLRALGH